MDEQNIQDIDRQLAEIENAPEIAPQVDTAIETDTVEPIQASPEPPVVDTAEYKMPIIDDKLINSLSEEDRGIAEKYRGKDVSEFVKAYRNALALHSKKTIQNTPSVPQFNLPKQETTAPQQPDNVREQWIAHRLKEKFPNMPQDPEEYRNLNFTDPDLYWDIREAKKEITKEVDADLEQINDWKTNHVNYNWNFAREQAKDMLRYLQGFDLEPKDLGIELNDEFLNKLASSPDVFGNLHGLPILKDDALTRKFIDQYLPIMQEKIKTKYRTEGFKQQEQIKPKPNLNSVPNGTTITPKKTAEEMSQSELDAQLAALETQLIGKK